MTAPMASHRIRIKWDDVEALRASDEGARDGLLGAARIILEASNQIVPFDLGGLMRSGSVDFDPGMKTATVYYDTVYAAKLHQNPAYNFKGGRRGRWLGSATQQSRTRVLDRFGEGLRVRFSRRGGTSGV